MFFWFLLFGFGVLSLAAQSITQGQIFQPVAGAGQLVLDPNGDGFVSAAGTGFLDTKVDYGVASEIPFHPLPVLFPEVKNDTRTGSSHTDLIGISVTGYQDPGAFVYNDGTNLLFRQRLMDHSTDSKGYGFLFDTSLNGKADYEIVLRTGGGQAGITIYDSGGVQIGNRIPLSNNFQKSVAALVNTGSADEQTYFYDWYVPWETLPFNPPDQFRGIAFTLTSAVGGYLSEGTIADIAGLDDRLFPNQDLAVLFALASQPITSGTSLEEGGGFQEPVTSTPSIFSPVVESSNNVDVNGTSAEAEGTSIVLNVYADASATSSVSGPFSATVNSNGLWTATVSSLTAGQFLSATADATGKGISGESARVRVLAAPDEDIGEVGEVCTPVPINTARVQGRNFTGIVPGLQVPTTSSQVTIRLYNINDDGTKGSMYASTDGGDSAEYKPSYVSSSQNDSSGDFTFNLNSPRGNIYSDVDNLYVTAQRDGLCESDINFDGSGTRPDAPVITTSQIEAGSGRTVSGTSTAANDSTVTIYANDDNTIIGTATVQTNVWTTTLSASVTNGDAVYARVTGTINSARSNTVIVGVDQTAAPVITGQYTSGSNSVSGYTQTGGQTVRIFLDGTFIGTTSSNAFGSWTIDLTALNSPVTLSGGNELTADAQASGESRSELSEPVTVASGTSPPNAPTVTGPITAGDPNISVSGNSGTVSFFADGELIGTTTGTSITLSPVDAALYILQGVAITAINTSGGLSSNPSLPVIVEPSTTVDAIRLVVTPANPIAGSTVTIISNVTDPFGGNMKDQGVTFSRVSGNGNLIGSSISNSGKTDQFGVVRITYETSATVEEATIGGETNPSDQVTIQTVAGSADASKSTITVSPDKIEADGSSTSTITVTLKDANDNVRTAGGDAVFLVTDAGTLSTVTDNADGTYTATLTSTTTVVTATVTAYIGNNSSGDEIGSVEVDFVTGLPNAGQSEIAADPTTTTTDGSSTITVQLKDASGNDLGAGLDVFLAITSGTGALDATALTTDR